MALPQFSFSVDEEDFASFDAAVAGLRLARPARRFVLATNVPVMANGCLI